MQRARLLAEKVPRSVVSSSSLRDFIVGAWLDSVDEVRKADSILDEEDRNVVADDVCQWPLGKSGNTFFGMPRMSYRSYLRPCRIWSQTHEHPGLYPHCLYCQQLLRIGQIPEFACLLQKGTKQP